MPVAVAPGLVVAAAVTQAAEKLGQFFFEHGLDRRADIRPQTVFDRIISRCVGQWRKRRTVGSLLHRVISLAVAAAGWGVSVHPEIAPPDNFHHFRDTTDEVVLPVLLLDQASKTAALF
ncbi:hypothetical protein D3C76_1364660 [compost metagenome]